VGFNSSKDMSWRLLYENTELKHALTLECVSYSNFESGISAFPIIEICKIYISFNSPSIENHILHASLSRNR